MHFQLLRPWICSVWKSSGAPSCRTHPSRDDTPPSFKRCHVSLPSSSMSASKGSRPHVRRSMPTLDELRAASPQASAAILASPHEFVRQLLEQLDLAPDLVGGLQLGSSPRALGSSRLFSTSSCTLFKANSPPQKKLVVAKLLDVLQHLLESILADTTSWNRVCKEHPRPPVCGGLFWHRTLFSIDSHEAAAKDHLDKLCVLASVFLEQVVLGLSNAGHHT